MSNALSSGESGSLRSLDLRLPPLPQTLPQVLELLHRPGFVPAEELAEVVQGDPAAVARLLKHINSAYYGLRRSITSVERAIRMMGPTTAAGTVIGLRMLEMEDLLHGPAGPCLARLLRHSESTAFLTQYLLGRAAPEANAPDPTANAPGGKGFAEGLLHDFGKLVLLYNYPEKAAALYDEQVLDEYLAGTEARARTTRLRVRPHRSRALRRRQDALSARAHRCHSPPPRARPSGERHRRPHPSPGCTRRQSRHQSHGACLRRPPPLAARPQLGRLRRGARLVLLAGGSGGQRPPDGSDERSAGKTQ